MNVPHFLYLIDEMDPRGLRSPLSQCLQQVNSSAEQRDFELMAVLAKHGRDVASACKDRSGEALFSLHMGLAHFALHDLCAAQSLFQCARTLFACTADAGARTNEAISAACLAVLSQSKNRDLGAANPMAQSLLVDALRQLDSAQRRCSEAGDADGTRHVERIRAWVEDQIDGWQPALYYNGSGPDAWGGETPAFHGSCAPTRVRDAGFLPIV